MVGDLVGFLKVLEEERELVHITEEVDPKYEVAAVIKEAGKQGGPALLFERVKGYTMPVAGNLLGTARRLALALETQPGKEYETYLERKKQPVEPIVIDRGPVHETVYTGEAVDIPGILPVLTYHEHDVGPYLTQGVVVMRDPETGRQTMGIHRIQVRGPRRLGLYLASRASSEFLRKAEQKGESLDVAIVVGVPPSVLLAAVAWFPFGDKLALAGGLRGAAVPLVRGRTVHVDYPAQAMIAIEGRILPGVREVDGPFGESTGYYITDYSCSIEVTALTHRNDAVYTAFVPWDAESDRVLSLAYGAEMWEDLRAAMPALRGLRYSFNGWLAMAVAPGTPRAEARRLLYRALADNPYVKLAIVVDTDVDLDDYRDLVWALASRFQPDVDTVVLSDVPASPIDPSQRKGPGIPLGGKLGLVATIPAGEEEKFRRIASPAASVERARAILARYSL